MRPMVSGERLVLSTLLAGLYLPGIEEIYLKSRQCLEDRWVAGETREKSLEYTFRSQEYINSFEFSCDSGFGRGLAPLSSSQVRDLSCSTAKDSLALYGGGRRLVDLLRERPPSLAEAPDLLRRHGFASEASRLEQLGLLDLARQFILEGAVLTPFQPEAEWIWNRVARLPYALWCAAPGSKAGPTEFPRRLFAVVGSREADSLGAKCARAAGKALQQGGWTLITGGALGVDSLALDAVGGTMTPRGVVLHPHGLGTAAGQKLRNRWPWAWHLSLCAPWQEFEGRWAHQRNRIIFALSEGAVSIGPRFRRGGTWSGALECLRGRLAPLALVTDAGEAEALSALRNLGAFEVAYDDLAGSRGPEIIGQIVQEGKRRRSGAVGLDSGQGILFSTDPPDRIAVYGAFSQAEDSDGVREGAARYEGYAKRTQSAA